MQIKSLKTSILQPPKDDLLAVLSFLPIQNKDVLVITSKVVSIHQGRCIKIDEMRKEQQKKELIQQEADEIVNLDTTPNLKKYPLTKKYGVVVGSAGIDESNGNGFFVLWPNQPAVFVKYLFDWLKRQYKLDQLGVIITDTVKRPFRRGAIGLAIAHYGFKAIYSYKGQKDIFGRRFKNETINIADSLAAAAVLTMGEGEEQTPLAIISDLPNLEFVDYTENVVVAGSDDYFFGLIDESKWKKTKKQVDN